MFIDSHTNVNGYKKQYNMFNYLCRFYFS